MVHWYTGTLVHWYTDGTSMVQVKYLRTKNHEGTLMVNWYNGILMVLMVLVHWYTDGTLMVQVKYLRTKNHKKVH